MYLPTCLGATEAETAPAYMKKYAYVNTLHDAEEHDAAA